MSEDLITGPSLLRSSPWGLRPLSLLISLYEENYRLCQMLLGPSTTWPSWRQSDGRGPSPIMVKIIARSTHTATFEIGFSSCGIQPTFIARLYEDLKVCEALGFAESGLPWKMPTGSELNLDRRWARNMAFQKWIHYAWNQAYFQV